MQRRSDDDSDEMGGEDQSEAKVMGSADEGESRFQGRIPSSMTRNSWRT